MQLHIVFFIILQIIRTRWGTPRRQQRGAEWKRGRVLFVKRGELMRAGSECGGRRGTLSLLKNDISGKLGPL